MARLKALLLALLFLLPGHALADELRPAYVELTQREAGLWDIRWKASEQSLLGQKGALILPANCALQGPYQAVRARTNIIRTGQMRCEGALYGQSIGLEGLASSTTDALVRIAPLADRQDGLLTLRLTPKLPAQTIPSETVISNVAATYAWLGLEHILLGFDHLLFVLSLVLLIRDRWMIVKAITAFTVAHSMTLIGTTLGYLSLPQRPVEAVIALSIVFLALEIVQANRGEAPARLSERYPWLVALFFGLIHGFGFAGALAEIGLPQGDVPLALLTFNVGVEIGQLAVVGAALLLLGAVNRIAAKALGGIRLACAYAVGSIAMYWLIERLV